MPHSLTDLVGITAERRPRLCYFGDLEVLGLLWTGGYTAEPVWQFFPILNRRGVA